MNRGPLAMAGGYSIVKLIGRADEGYSPDLDPRRYVAISLKRV